MKQTRQAVHTVKAAYIFLDVYGMNQTFLTFLKKKVSLLISKIFPGSGHLHFAFFTTTTTTTATTTTSASRQAITLF